MSLPERTVDAWVAGALVTRFPRAELWAPTQNDDPRNWDLASQVTGSKTVILENKATTPNKGGSHRINIDLTQLGRYQRKLAPELYNRLYYVLPSPPWRGGTTGRRWRRGLLGPVPLQAATRVRSPLGAFEDWAFVMPAQCLRLWLRAEGRNSVNTGQLPTFVMPVTASELKCPACKGVPWSLREFFEGLATCGIGSPLEGGATRRILPSAHPPGTPTDWDLGSNEHELADPDSERPPDDEGPRHEGEEAPGSRVSPIVATIPAEDLQLGQGEASDA